MRQLIPVLFALGYGLSLAAGLVFYFEGGRTSTFWPAVGLLTGALLITPVRRWPMLLVIAAVVFLGVMLLADLRSDALFLGGSLLVNLCEPLLVAALMRRFIPRPAQPDRTSWVLAFLLIGVVLGPAIGSIAGVLVIPASSSAATSTGDWLQWWFADGLGMLLVTPVVLAWKRFSRIAWRPPLTVEAVVITTVMIALVSLIIAEAANIERDVRLLTYLSIPLFVWSAARLPLQVPVTLNLCFCVMLIMLTDAGIGSFIARFVDLNASDEPTGVEGITILLRDVGSLQVFIVVMSMTVLFLAAAMSERLHAVTSRLEAEETSRSREAQVDLLFTQMPGGLWTVDRELVFTSTAGSMLSKLSLEDDSLVGRTLQEVLNTDDPTYRPIASHMKALEGEAGEYEVRWGGKLFRARVEPMRNKTGQVVGAIGAAIDITDRKQFEESLEREARVQQLLLRELDHRVRNNLGTLLSLIQLSARRAASKEALAEMMAGRVQAMAIAHSQLSAARFTAGSVRPLIAALLSAMHVSDRVHQTGPDIPLSVAQTSALAMIVHELLTNSQKYGALTHARGRIDIETSIDVEHQTGLLRWTETDGPTIAEAPRAGVGLSIVEGLARTDLRGRVSFNFRSDGAQHTIEFPLDEESQRLPGDQGAPP